MMAKNADEIYLDANATTPVLPAAATAAHEAMQELYGNPSSSHTSGLRAKHILESARGLCRTVLGAQQGQIVFTSGATEAIQLGIFSALCKIRERRLAERNASAPSDWKTATLLFGATEHKAVPQSLKQWNELLGVNNKLVPIPVDRNGLLDLDFLAAHAAHAELICTMAVNNETGVITNLAAVEKTIRAVNPSVVWLVDCVQAIGKLNLDLGKTSIDFAAFSGHKIYSPKGIGLLYVRPGTTLVPLLTGGGQEQGARGGTENLPGVAAIAAVLERVTGNETRTFATEHQLQQFRDRIVADLKQSFPTIVFNHSFELSVPTTINFAVKGFTSKELLDLFDAAGIRVSSGSACGSAIQGSYVLEAMGLPRWQTDGAIRLSFGPLATESEIASACQRIRAVGRALCESCLVVSPEFESGSSPLLDGLVQLKNGSMCTWLWLDSASKRCVIVDPFAELADRIESLVRCQNSSVVAILDTHAHVDHDSCRTSLLESLRDLALESAHTDDVLGWPQQSDGEATLADGSTSSYMRISNDTIIAQTDLPGHTQIGRAFMLGTLSDDQRLLPQSISLAFTGDMILMGGVGRTDFDSSAPAAMYDSLRRLSSLISESTLICPTHDYNNDFATTLKSEIASNDFLQRLLDPLRPITRAEFLQQKPAIDAGVSDATNSELVCGLIQKRFEEPRVSLDLHKHELKTFFQQHRGSLIIDVREPQEFAFAQDWTELGFDSPPQNVPLTRLAGYLSHCLTDATKSASAGNETRDIIFLCRSGKRSEKAAQVARRLGILKVRHIAGGIALNVSRQCPVADPIAESGYVI